MFVSWQWLSHFKLVDFVGDGLWYKMFPYLRWHCMQKHERWIYKPQCCILFCLESNMTLSQTSESIVCLLAKVNLSEDNIGMNAWVDKLHKISQNKLRASHKICIKLFWLFLYYRTDFQFKSRPKNRPWTCCCNYLSFLHELMVNRYWALCCLINVETV